MVVARMLGRSRIRSSQASRRVPENIGVQSGVAAA